MVFPSSEDDQLCIAYLAFRCVCFWRFCFWRRRPRGPEPPRPFHEGRSGNAELKYINDLPVLMVAGTPEEIGRQKADLTADVVRKIADYPRQLLDRSSHKDRLPKYLEMSKGLAQHLPADYREEMRAFAERSGVDRDMGILGQHAGRHLSRHLLLGVDRRAGKERHQAARCSAAIWTSTPSACWTSTVWSRSIVRKGSTPS